MSVRIEPVRTVSLGDPLEEVRRWREVMVDELAWYRGRVEALEAAAEARGASPDGPAPDDRYRAMVELIHEGLGIVDPEENIVFANRAYGDILGLPAGAAVGRNLRELLDEDDFRRVRAETALRRAGRTSVYELDLRRPSGEVRRVRVTASPWFEGEAFLGTLGAVVDVTAEARTEAALRASSARWRRAVEGTIRTVAAISERRDPYTAGHQRRVARLAGAAARGMGWSEEASEGVEWAARVHDVGKICVPAEILSRPGRLSEDERALIRTHAACAEELLADIEYPWPVAAVAAQHHERLDGSGYPRGLRGEAILPAARVVAVADVVEAMASDRPYRPALGLPAALAEIRRGRGTAYDPAVVDVCLDLFERQGFRFE